jgi:hypothetical protein
MLSPTPSGFSSPSLSTTREVSLLGSDDSDQTFFSGTSSLSASSSGPTTLPPIVDLMGFDPANVIITNEQGHSAAGSPVGSLQRSSSFRASLPPSSDRSLGGTSGQSSRSMSMMFDEPSEFDSDSLVRSSYTRDRTRLSCSRPGEFAVFIRPDLRMSVLKI